MLDLHLDSSVNKTFNSMI